jgi:hypothetical protein
MCDSNSSALGILLQSSAQAGFIPSCIGTRQAQEKLRPWATGALAAGWVAAGSPLAEERAQQQRAVKLAQLLRQLQHMVSGHSVLQAPHAALQQMRMKASRQSVAKVEHVSRHWHGKGRINS